MGDLHPTDSRRGTFMTRREERTALLNRWTPGVRSLLSRPGLVLQLAEDENQVMVGLPGSEWVFDFTEGFSNAEEGRSSDESIERLLALTIAGSEATRGG
jgi:hypothetical protein